MTPATVVFVSALLASAALHLNGWLALGLIDPPVAAAPPPIEVDLDFAAADEPDQPASSEAPQISPPAPEPTTEPPRPEPAHTETSLPRQTPPARAAPPPPPPPEVAVTPPAPAEATPAPPPPPATPPPANAHPITQASDDPNVEPPPDARFVADEARRVEEETVAELRNMDRDDPTPAATSPEHAEEDEGTGEDEVIADLRDADGSDERTPTPQEAQRERPLQTTERRLTSRPAQGDQLVAGEGEAGAEAARGTASGGEAGAQARAGGGEAPRPLAPRVIHDPAGDFILAPPPGRIGVGAGDAGGEARPGGGVAERGAGAGSGGRRGEGGRGAGRRMPNLRVSWSVLEETYGAEDLEAEREAYAAERQSRIHGGARGRRWREFRAAIENFVSDIRPGNTTALNAARAPFASYIADVHRRIHREFRDRFVAGLPSDGPLSDRTLAAKLDITLNPDGSVDRVGVIETSGYLPYDYGAFDAVMRAQPYPTPPEEILSADGKVHFRWAFANDQPFCHPINAEMYILRGDGGGPGRPPPIRDDGEPEAPAPSDGAPGAGALAPRPRRRAVDAPSPFG